MASWSDGAGGVRAEAWRLSTRPGGTASLWPEPCVMGIVNTSPDSFHGASAYATVEAAVECACRMVREGAMILDVGGASTRPGAAPVDEREQVARTAPVIRAIRASDDQRVASALITIDTTRSAVARAALDAGADAINDVSAGTDDEAMLDLAARTRCGLVLMHRALPPHLDRYSDQYRAGKPGASSGSAPGDAPMGEGTREAVDAVVEFLHARASAARARGIEPEALALDPGLGFGKTVAQNLALIGATERIACAAGGEVFPVVSALSRKSFVGRVSLGSASETDQRLEGTLALSVLHAARGASIFRVHDVGAHVRALRAARAALEAWQDG